MPLSSFSQHTWISLRNRSAISHGEKTFKTKHLKIFQKVKKKCIYFNSIVITQWHYNITAYNVLMLSLLNVLLANIQYTCHNCQQSKVNVSSTTCIWSLPTCSIHYQLQLIHLAAQCMRLPSYSLQWTSDLYCSSLHFLPWLTCTSPLCSSLCIKGRNARRQLTTVKLSRLFF